MPTFLIACVSILLSVAAQFSLKAGMSRLAAQAALAPTSGWSSAWAMATEPGVIGGFALYGLGAVVWLSVLSQWDVSKAYPLVGLGFVLTAAIGWLSGEPVSLLRLAGVALICTGVVAVARS